MFSWNGSLFLQALGRATLNSLWQMAALWCCFLLINHFFRLSPFIKYKVAVTAVFAGTLWAVAGFFTAYYQTVTPVSVFGKAVINDAVLRILLSSASATYLLLLFFPLSRFYKNWIFVKKLKTKALHKADLHYRLFVQKISCRLGIPQKVKVYISGLINAPVTIGYLKPVILLPVAMCNHLSVAQTEAVLLHELSHIKRSDYLINLILSVIHTFLYFNPFVKQFVKIIEEERETCCDNLVIRYGYDKISYVTALLSLEKLSATHSQTLLLGATGKAHLLTRIEKMAGMEKKKTFKLNQFAGIVTVVLCIIVLNSLLLLGGKGDTTGAYTYNNVLNPFAFNDDAVNISDSDLPQPTHLQPYGLAGHQQLNGVTHIVAAVNDKYIPFINRVSLDELATAEVPEKPYTLTPAAFDVSEGSLSPSEKEHVEKTIEETKKVVGNLQWNQVEASIADAMTASEKECAKSDYLRNLEESDMWNNVEASLKAQYQHMDWPAIDNNLKSTLTDIKLDSLRQTYNDILVVLNKASAEAAARAKVTITPMPDISMEKLAITKDKLKQSLDTIKAVIRIKKTIKL